MKRKETYIIVMKIPISELNEEMIGSDHGGNSDLTKPWPRRRS